MHETEKPLITQFTDFSLKNLFLSFFITIILSFVAIVYNLANHHYMQTEDLISEVFSAFFLFVVLTTFIFISFHLINGLKNYFEN